MLMDDIEKVCKERSVCKNFMINVLHANTFVIWNDPWEFLLSKVFYLEIDLWTKGKKVKMSSMDQANSSAAWWCQSLSFMSRRMSNTHQMFLFIFSKNLTILSILSYTYIFVSPITTSLISNKVCNVNRQTLLLFDAIKPDELAQYHSNFGS